MPDLFGSLEPLGAPSRPAMPRARTAGLPTVRDYSVALLNSVVRELLESACPPVWVAGEVTGWKRYGSGHCYFTLRDAEAQVRCVMFRADAQRLPTDPAEGMQVRALGTVTLYEKRGDFQLVVRELEGQGEGGLFRLALERLRARLDAEGLLAPERKRPLPACPGTVGVVTSPVGAVIHDILHVIGRRAPWTRVVLSPARVQGDGAAEDLARAIRLFSRGGGADVLIVGRGGGSAEDLWAFNQEVVARAIAECPIPVISAVGHETDVTIADLVADLRAPTPSAAAEAAVPDARVLARQLAEGGARLEAALRRKLQGARQDVARLRDDLVAAVRAVVDARRMRMALVAGRLEALSPLAVLRRGYAVPLSEAGRVLRRAADFLPGEAVLLRIVDATVGCRIEDVRRDAALTVETADA